MIHAADDLRRVLVTNRANYVKGAGFDRVRILLGHGLITSDGELWARQRAMMQLMFHRRILAQFARRFRLRLAPGQQVALEARVNLRPAQPMLMTLELR